MFIYAVVVLEQQMSWDEGLGLYRFSLDWEWRRRRVAHNI